MELIGSAVFVVAIFVVVFIVFRSFILWYWRMNEVADTLNEINANIAKLAGVEPLPKKVNKSKKANKPKPDFKRSKNSDWQ